MEKKIHLVITYEIDNEEWLETCLDEMIENATIIDYEII